MNERRENSQNGEQRVRCLIWLPAGYEAPLELLDGLRMRQVTVRQAHDAPTVMAELVTDEYQLIILIKPRSLRRAGNLIAAARCYWPKLTIWQYDPDTQPALRAWDPQTSAPDHDPAPVPLDAPIDSVPEPEPAPDVLLEDTPQDPPPADPLTPTVLSEEELSMLLDETEEPHQS